MASSDGSSPPPADSDDSLIRRVARTPDVSPGHAIGETVAGRYQLRALLGQGGMGRVFEADDLELGRAVAIKLVRPEILASDEARGRFVHERLLTAELEHPAIVPVYDSGVLADGVPYYVMRIARGESLDRRLGAARSRSERLALLPNVIAVAEAIAFAHSRGIIHRDLKPSNVLVGSFGETLVADWGLAKRLGPAAEEPRSPSVPSAASGETDAHVVLGTPAYMAPEQRDGGVADERVDVYALGATLNQLITGRPPSGAGERKRPASPMTGALADLVAIVDKATQVDPAARYRSAAELVDELHRLQTGQLVGARTYTRLELFRRWAGRHRSELSIALGLCAILVVVAVIGVARVVEERNVAMAQRARADAARRDATLRNEALVLLEARAELTRDPTASLAWLKRYPATASGWAEADDIAADARARGVARHVWDLREAVGSVAFSPDGGTLAIGALSGSLTLIDIATGVRRVLHAPDGVGDRVVFSPDGAHLATSDGVEVVRLWERATGASRRLEGEHAGGPYLRFSSDGAMLVARHAAGGARVWRVGSGAPVSLPDGEDALYAFVPGGHLVAAATRQLLSIVNPETGKRSATLPISTPPHDLEVSGDGRYIAVTLRDALLAWAPATGETRRISAPPGAPQLLVPSPDGRRFMTCGSASLPQLWVFDLEQRSARQFASDERCSRQAFEFSPDGQQFVSSAFSSDLRLHDVPEARTMHLLGHEGINDATFSPDGRWLASASSDRTVRLWRLGEGVVRVFHELEALDRIAASGQILVSDPNTGALALVDARSGERHRMSGPRAPEYRQRGALSLDGRVAVFPDNAALTVWDVRRGVGRALRAESDVLGGVTGESLSPDGTLLAQTDVHGAVRVIDLASGSVRELARLGDLGFAVAVSDDGSRVAAASRDGTARVYDLRTGGERARIRVPGWAWLLEFSRDGTRLAVGCSDGIPRILDIATGRSQELRGHVGGALGIDFTHDGRRAVSSGVDGTLRLWDLDTGRGRVVRREPNAVEFTALSPDGSLVLTRSFFKVVVWDPTDLPPLDGDPARLGTWMGRETSAEVDGAGLVRTP